MFTGLLQSIFIMTKVGNLLEKLTDPTVIIIRVGFMALCNAWVGNLHKDQMITLDFFLMVEVGNLDTYLGRLFQSIFIMAEVGNLLEKITDPMAILIRVVKWMTRCF